MKPMEVRLVGRFRFHSKIEGEHEAILYRAIHSQTNERLVLKGEEIKNAKPKRGCLSLLQQGKIYQSMQGGIGIPFMHWCGQQQDFNFIVLEQLQCTLSKLLMQCDGKFTLKTALMIGIEMVSILQYCHFKYFIYNNVNPKHIMSGRAQKYGQFFLIDFSKANRYRDANTLEHTLEPTDKTWEIRNYNMEFSSINYHKGNAPSRRDDMESLLYLIYYLIKGDLPWSNEVRNMKKTDFEKSRQTLELKYNYQENLFKGYAQLQTLYNYTTSLKFDEKPQYSYYASIFGLLLQKHHQINDKVYDWMLLEDEEPVEELTHKFEIIENQTEFLEKAEVEAKKKSSQNNQSNSKSSKTLEKAAKGSKHDKQCVIY